MCLRPDDMVLETAFGPRAAVCRPLFQLINLHTNFFPLGRVAGAAVVGRLDIPHDFQQSLIVLLALHKRRAEQNRRCNQRHLVVAWQVAFPWVWQEGFASPFFPGYCGHEAKAQQLSSLYSEKWLKIQGFTKFTTLCTSSRNGTPWTLSNNKKKKTFCRLYMR